MGNEELRRLRQERMRVVRQETRRMTCEPEEAEEGRVVIDIPRCVTGTSSTGTQLPLTLASCLVRTWVVRLDRQSTSKTETMY